MCVRVFTAVRVSGTPCHILTVQDDVTRGEVDEGMFLGERLVCRFSQHKPEYWVFQGPLFWGGRQRSFLCI